MSQSVESARPHVVILTAGGAGMFCGSCLHDNTWARVLRDAGYEISLVPTYTPIRVDEENLSSSRVFFGGVNVYLNARWGWWRAIPAVFKRWLDRPAVIRGLTRWGVSTDASQLGELTLAMLAGLEGPQRDAVQELAVYLQQLQPDYVLFTNALLAGALRGLRAVCPARMYCILQGDDIFLEGLVAPWKSRVLERVRGLAREFDGFVVQSRYYRDFMSDYLQLPADRFHQIPLAIDCHKHDGRPRLVPGVPPVIGYFARICPEKGLQRLVEACLILRQRGCRFRLRAGGYLPAEHKAYLDVVRRTAEPLGDDFDYVGSPDTHAEKVSFFQSLDVLSIPTIYREPKGLTVLEAMANGVPVVLPNHGAFPEIIAATNGGLLFPPDDMHQLADQLETMLTDSGVRTRCAESGWAGVRAQHDVPNLAAASDRLFCVVH